MNFYQDSFGRQFDLDRSFKISITQTFDSTQPNHFGTALASRRPIGLEGFSGRVDQGSGCNCDVIELIPHCNGTHTESVGHIVNTEVAIADVRIPALQPTLLTSVRPVLAQDVSETYRPKLEETDRLITAASLKRACRSVEWDQFQALIVRTLPNELDKMERKYGVDETPPFFSVEAIEFIFECGIDHLLVDLPSIDKMYDQGLLTCHHIFWNVIEGTNEMTDRVKSGKTITEMIFVHEAIRDGTYLLNLQVADWRTDAAVSRPVIFPLA